MSKAVGGISPSCRTCVATRRSTRVTKKALRVMKINQFFHRHLPSWTPCRVDASIDFWSTWNRTWPSTALRCCMSLSTLYNTFPSILFSFRHCLWILSEHWYPAVLPINFFFYFLFHDLSRIGSRTGMFIHTYTPTHTHTHILVTPVLLFTTIEVSVVFFLAGLIWIFPR